MKRMEPFTTDRTALRAEFAAFEKLLGPPTRELSEFACDLALGDRDNGQFCFIEFEDATADSVFRQGGTRGIPDWSPRLEHGLSQIVDWFYLLDDHRHTQQFRTFFSTDLAHSTGLLVIGRDGFLTDPLRHRLRWRSQHTALNGKAVQIVTFDALLQTLRVNVDLFAQPIQSPPAVPKATKKKPKK